MNTGEFTGDLYSLDVTQPWSKSKPLWANITTPSKGTLTGPKTGFHSGTLSKDGSTLFFTNPTKGAPFLYQYDIASASWSTVNAPPAQAASWATRTSADLVTDKNTGALWLVGGMVDNTSGADKFQNGDWSIQAMTLPGSNVINNHFSGTAHIYNSKIFIFGGITSSVGKRTLQSFQVLPTVDVSGPTPTFGTQLTQGSFPQARQDHCSVLTDSLKVLVYGGYDPNGSGTAFQDLWSLDLITWTWTLLNPTGTSNPRYGHVCNIVGANMIVFAGRYNATRAYAKDTQVYDVMEVAWVDSYAPKQDTTEITKGSGGNGGAGGLSTGAVVGIVIGVLAVVALIVGFVLFKRRQKQIAIREAEMEKEAYLASLRPEVGNDTQTKPRYSPRSPRSPNTMYADATPTTPTAAHHGAYNNVDEILLNGAAASPGMGGQGQPNVQYLMQHLPDGTIAVQPVYLDHHAVPSSMPGSPTGVYVAPPPSGVGSGLASPGPVTSAASPYVMPPNMRQSHPTAYPPPSHDPFASPALANAPLPPGYHSSARSGPSSPHQEHGNLH